MKVNQLLIWDTPINNHSETEPNPIEYRLPIHRVPVDFQDSFSSIVQTPMIGIKVYTTAITTLSYRTVPYQVHVEPRTYLDAAKTNIKIKINKATY